MPVDKPVPIGPRKTGPRDQQRHQPVRRCPEALGGDFESWVLGAEPPGHDEPHHLKGLEHVLCRAGMTQRGLVGRRVNSFQHEGNSVGVGLFGPEADVGAHHEFDRIAIDL